MPDTTPATTPVTHVRIVPGCIICGLCEDTCPQVFSVREDTCIVRSTADRHYESQSARIIQAARECPVDVIKVKGVVE